MKVMFVRKISAMRYGFNSPTAAFHHRYDGYMLAFDECPKTDDPMIYLLFLTRNEEQRDNHCVCSARAALAAHGV